MTYVQMMVPRALLAVAAVLLCTSTTHASATAPDKSRVLWQGPALAGTSVVWGEEGGGHGSIHQWTAQRGERALYSSDALALTRPLAASRRFLAFERGYPGCKPEPNVVCPQVQDAVVGPFLGPFRTLMRPRKCSLPTLGTTLALDGGIAAYLDLDCTAQRVRVVVRDVGHAKAPRVVHAGAVSAGCCRDVAIAGRFVAWSDRRDVVVYDRLANRIAYSAHIGPRAGIDVDLGFDLQQDGKVAVAYRLIELARTVPTTIAWLSPSSPRPHVLPLRGSDTDIRIAGDRVVFDRFVNPNKSVLTLASLTGHSEAVASFSPPVRTRTGFDFDGQHIAWASDRVATSRVDCPPAGQARPCVHRETGVTSIWFRAARGGTPRLIVRLPFFDTIAWS